MGKSPPDSRSRRTKHKRAMKLAISLLFIAAVSKEAPSVTLRRTMPTGHAENTLAQNQKQTAMKIQKDVVPWIQHLENILKLSIERQHNETSQLYKYIDATTSHTTAEGVKRIRLAGKDLSVGDVFDKTRGFFRVPKGGSGEYSISVGMVQRVYDWQFTFGEP